jgi:NDP-sugar pyrophosphorylase family protein
MPPPDHALVLTAGLGTRLRPLTEVRAKPAIPVAGEPLVRRIVRWLAGNGVREVVLNLHHLPETIAAVMGDGSDLSARVRYSWEQPLILGAAGGPRQALSILASESFLILNGDTLTDVDLHALSESHSESGALVTLALVPNPEPHRYGGVRLDDQHRVVGFPGPGSTGEDSYHFIGVQVAQAEAFRELPIGRPTHSIRGLYDELIAARPGSIRGFVSRAAFWDVGTVADYWKTSWALADLDGAPEVCGGRHMHIASTARVSRSILWDDVEVSDDCVIEECVVTDGVSVPSGSRFRRTILVREPGGANLAFPF